MIGNDGKLEYIVFCFGKCLLCYNEMIFVLCGNEDYKKLLDLLFLKVVFYFYF